MDHDRLQRSNSFSVNHSNSKQYYSSLQTATPSSSASSPNKNESTHWYRLDSNHKIKTSSKTKITNSIVSNLNTFYDLFNTMPELKQFQTR
jgi:hypothetical protein